MPNKTFVWVHTTAPDNEEYPRIRMAYDSATMDDTGELVNGASSHVYLEFADTATSMQHKIMSDIEGYVPDHGHFVFFGLG